jgi:beta-lactam-binding protein with PASTA domain
VVRREWRVRVSESLGPQKVEVPNVTGTPERAAALNLRRVGLEAGASAHLPDGRVAEGTILAQDPPPKAQGIERPSVNLLVAGPDDTTTDGFVMPDLVGLPIVAAQSALTRVGIKTAEPKFVDVPLTSIPAVGTAVAAQAVPGQPGTGGGTAVAPTANPPVGPTAPVVPARTSALPGTVLSQSPPPGWRVEVGSTVALTVVK